MGSAHYQPNQVYNTADQQIDKKIIDTKNQELTQYNHDNPTVKNILLKINKAHDDEKKHNGSIPKERFDAVVELIKLYFQLGQEVNKNVGSKLDGNVDIVRQTAHGISDNAFKIEAFIREFTMKYLTYDIGCCPELNCIIVSGLMFMFDLYESNLILEYSDGNVTFDEVVESIKQEGDFDVTMDEFKYWWKTECYFDNEYIPDTIPETHWWWK